MAKRAASKTGEASTCARSRVRRAARPSRSLAWDYGAGDIVVRVAGNPVGQPGIHQQANALAGQKVLAGQCQYRYAHPQCLGGGGSTGIGKRVKGDIHPVVGGQIVCPSFRPFEDKA